jgi:hypothetical protein
MNEINENITEQNTYNSKLPVEFKMYFWEYDLNSLDINDDYFLIIERIMNLGDINSINWMLKHYPENIIKSVLIENRSIRNITKNYWSIIFNDKAISQRNISGRANPFV